MRLTEFKKLFTIENDNEKEMNKLNIGDCFLYGKNLTHQKESKKVGEPITYYLVIGKKENNIEYTPVYDYMEKDKGEEK